MPAADPLGGGPSPTSGAVAVAVDVVHLAAGSIWVGGLSFTVLALLLAGADRWPLAARAVPRFSTLAVFSVVTLIAAGSFRGYQEVRAFHGLWDTTYGKLLLVKIALVLRSSPSAPTTTATRCPAAKAGRLGRWSNDVSSEPPARSCSSWPQSWA